MLDIRRNPVDACFPGHDRIPARIDRDHRRGQRNLVAHLDLCGDGVDIDAATAKQFGDDSIFGSADDRSAQGNDVTDEIGALAGKFTRQIASGFFERRTRLASIFWAATLTHYRCFGPSPSRVRDNQVVEDNS